MTERSVNAVEMVCIYCVEPGGDHDACERNVGLVVDETWARCACWAMNHRRAHD